MRLRIFHLLDLEVCANDRVGARDAPLGRGTRTTAEYGDLVEDVSFHVTEEPRRPIDVAHSAEGGIQERELAPDLGRGRRVRVGLEYGLVRRAIETE